MVREGEGIIREKKAPERERSSGQVGAPPKTVAKVPLNPNKGAPGQSLLVQAVQEFGPPDQHYTRLRGRIV